jgi:predicted DNA-binding transcriptional regulator YafY
VVADTSGRTLELLRLLQLRRYWRGPELADRLSVSARTLRRDVERLRGLGYVIESTPSHAGGYQLTSGPTLPPMAFTDDEAVALAMGLRDVAHGGDPDTAAASLHALAKLVAILPPGVRRRVEQLEHVAEGRPPPRRTDGPSAQVLGAVAQACQDGVRLRFRYLSHGAATAAERYVEPYRLVTRGRRWYLVAFDLDRADWRTFRVDRVSEPRAARNAFSPRPLPADDLERYVTERIASLRQPARTVEFEVALDHVGVQARLGSWASVRDLGGGRSLVSLAADDLDWAVFAIMTLDAAFVALDPELRAHVERRRRLLAGGG